MDLNSPLFDRIRIRPSCDEPKKAEGPACDRPGCTQPGLHKAPKGRKQEGQYWRFCMQHVREYNASYNYFDGMNDAAVQAYQKDAVIGHRPTWTMGVNRAGKPARSPRRPSATGITSIPSASCAARARARPRHAAPGPSRRRRATRPRCARRWTCSASTRAPIRPPSRRSTSVLVKRFHPDANGGDRSFEDRLRDIIKAHDTLRGAGLC